ncbi:MAG: 2-hydroxychromene-2-carboxylate isomerase [Pseudomonadales bacterium]|nr:2-hydroxychromene-2-carboxylate isomerase [Pseudomonadales bacterium]
MPTSNPATNSATTPKVRPRTLRFYFDFMSPFSYFAHLKLPDLTRKYDYEIDYQPIDIAAAKKAAGNYGPANREVPVKIHALIQDLKRWASYYDVPFSFPASMDCRRINIGALYAIQHQRAEQYVNSTFGMVWGQARSTEKPADPDHDYFLRYAAAAADLDTEEFVLFINSGEGEHAFKKSQLDAHSNGVFGAPIMKIDDQIWWGNDRLMFVEQYLKEH